MPPTEETSSGMLSVVIKFIIEKLEDYGFWLWAFIFFLGVLLANRFALIQLSAPNDLTNLTIVLCGFSLCMLMDAIKLHSYVYGRVVDETTWVKNLVRSRKLLRSARRDFSRIMALDCPERDWLLWYVFLWPPGTTYTVGLDSMRDRWDPICKSLMENCKIMKPVGEEYDRQNVRQLYSVESRFDLLSELQLFTESNESIEPELRQARDSAVKMTSEQVWQSKKQSLLSIDQAEAINKRNAVWRE
jgi:hypothetical protein